MELDLTEILIILTYASMLLEIVVFPVPSVASSFQLILRSKQLPNEMLYTRIQNLNLWQKIIILLLPTCLSIIAYCVPLILIFISKFSSVLIDKTENAKLLIAAYFIIICGRIISLYSVMKIRRNNRQVGKSFELKTGNIFSVSRNPILFGMYVSFIGMIILFPIWFMFIAFGYYFAHMHFRILIEESFLKNKFGERYTQYRQQTKRYF